MVALSCNCKVATSAAAHNTHRTAANSAPREKDSAAVVWTFTHLCQLRLQCRLALKGPLQLGHLLLQAPALLLLLLAHLGEPLSLLERCLLLSSRRDCSLLSLLALAAQPVPLPLQPLQSRSRLPCLALHCLKLGRQVTPLSLQSCQL